MAALTVFNVLCSATIWALLLRIWCSMIWRCTTGISDDRLPQTALNPQNFLFFSLLADVLTGDGYDPHSRPSQPFLCSENFGETS